MGAAAIIALIGSLIGPTVQIVQKLFPGTKADVANNTLKKTTVVDSLLPVLQALATAGKIPGVIPADVEAAVEASLAALQQIPGALAPPLPSTAPEPAKTYQVSGTMVVK